jgi:hypothetical protein
LSVYGLEEDDDNLYGLHVNDASSNNKTPSLYSIWQTWVKTTMRLQERLPHTLD